MNASCLHLKVLDLNQCLVNASFDQLVYSGELSFFWWSINN